MIPHMPLIPGRFIIVFFSLTALLAAPSAQAQSVGFAPESDLPSDPSITYGVMENGLSYALMENSEPEKRVAVRLFIRGGSIQEKEHQRGMAH